PARSLPAPADGRRPVRAGVVRIRLREKLLAPFTPAHDRSDRPRSDAREWHSFHSGLAADDRSLVPHPHAATDGHHRCARETIRVARSPRLVAEPARLPHRVGWYETTRRVHGR